VDFVIEAVPEKMEIKHAVFAELDAATPGHAILASNTSGLSITEIGDATNRPDKVVGFHFFWPASYMRLIEVIEGEDTSPETAQAAANFAQAIKKMPVRCHECPGFVVNRILVSTASEIWRYQDETGIDVEQLDQFITEKAQMPMGPFRVADMSGLDTVVKVARDMREAYGDRFYVHRGMEEKLERGELGAKSGQGFYPYPQADEGYETAPVKLDSRGEVAILWLDNPPANSLAPAVIEALDTAWRAIESGGEAKAMILASPNPALFCAGADIKAFTQLDEAGGRELLNHAHELFRDWEKSRIMTIAAVNGLALGGGCEIAMACDVRLAGFSASFGQPEINLGIIPGFGGTQRLPRLVGPAKALEMNTTGEPISAEEAFEYGLVNRLVPDHELFDTALAWAAKFARQAPLALENIKRASHQADLDDGIEVEKEAFATVFASEDAREGIGAFLQKRNPEFKGR
jgi:enoyl-CoA hydratase/carnithine racemase